MFLNYSYSNLCLLEQHGNFSFLWQVNLILLTLFVCCGNTFAQWVNNPSQNTRLVVDAVNPINISSVEDLKGGVFIFWEENRDNIQNEIYFLHVDGNGKVSFRADGKKVSENNSNKDYPVAVSNLSNTAVLVYKDFSSGKSGDLFAQKVLGNGNLLWQKNGVRLTSFDETKGSESKSARELTDYSAASDIRGNVCVSYITRDTNILNEFKVSVQKITQNGKTYFKQDGISAYSSAYLITQPNIIADEKGGAFLFWLETQNNRSTIYAQRVDSTGKTIWGKKPINVSGTAKNVISYSVKVTDFSSLYIAWQVQDKDKDIYHQLINTSGKILWGAGGKQSTDQKGNHINPQVLTEDSTIILCWTNEVGKERDVYIQKYNDRGRPLWKTNGTPVVELKGPQFGQKIIGDGKGGAIVAWIDRRVDSLKGNIYSQRVTVSGKLAWDISGVPVASYRNSEKSYLSVVSDKRGGAIFIFKDRREGKGELYGQKIFNTGTYVSQLIGFNAEDISDSVKISWYSANEMGKTKYDIERTTQSDSASTEWVTIGTISSDGESSAKFYEYYDKPSVAGTIYYRVVQSDNMGNFQPSDVARLNYLQGSSGIMVAQNTPNPFTEETVIEFYLPEQSTVSIDFFNSRVEEVKKIDSQTFPAGKNEIKFIAGDLQPGIYFYRFQVGDFVDVKKMVITKH